MIRRVFLVILSTLTIAAVVAFVLSYTVQSKLETLTQPQFDLPFDTYDDLALAMTISARVPQTVGPPGSKVDGLLIRLWKKESGSRAYLHAHNGTLEMMHLVPMSMPQNTPPPRTRGWFGFEFVKLCVVPPFLQPVRPSTPAGEQFLAECFCNATIVALPLWSIVLIGGAYPFAVLIIAPIRRHRRRKRNECVQCGYSLTGLTEPRCPECGSQVGSAVRTGC